MCIRDSTTGDCFGPLLLRLRNGGDSHGSRSRRRRAWLLGCRSGTSFRMPRWCQGPYWLSPLELPLVHRAGPVVGGVTSATLDTPFKERRITVLREVRQGAPHTRRSVVASVSVVPEALTPVALRQSPVSAATFHLNAEPKKSR